MQSGHHQSSFLCGRKRGGKEISQTVLQTVLPAKVIDKVIIMDPITNETIEILDIVSLQDNDSPYVKPFRFLYKQNGQTKCWDCVQTHDSVAILIYNRTRQVLVFVRQFRPPVYLSALLNNCRATLSSVNDLREKSKNLPADCGYTLELCAGVIDKPGLTINEIAREEVIEETGYQPPIESLELITSFRSGVGTQGALQHLFYCTVDDSMRTGAGGGIDDECIEVIEMSMEESRRHILASDLATGLGRTSGLRFAIMWFIHEKLAQLQRDQQ